MSVREIEQLNDVLNVNPGDDYGLRLDQAIEMANACKASIAVVTAQLDLDATVTDTDYAANVYVTVGDVTRI